MVYDFACKIKNVKNKDALNDETLKGIIADVDANYSIQLDFKFVLPSADRSSEFLVKAQASVSSMPVFHDRELEEAIEIFKSYLDEIAQAIHGEVSTSDGFYNNTQSFKRLFT